MPALSTIVCRQRQKDGTFGDCRIAHGIYTPAELKRCEVAVKYKVSLIKVRGGHYRPRRRPKDELPDIWRDLDIPAGYASGKSYRRARAVSGGFLPFWTGRQLGLAVKIEQHSRGIDTPGKLKLATAGCPRNCSEALIKDVSAVAIGDGKWEIISAAPAAPACAKVISFASSTAKTTSCSTG